MLKLLKIAEEEIAKEAIETVVMEAIEDEETTIIILKNALDVVTIVRLKKEDDQTAINLNLNLLTVDQDVLDVKPFC